MWWLFLIIFLPLSVCHAINYFFCGINSEVLSKFHGFGGIPFRQTIAAETRKVHQVNVLNILAWIKMTDKLSKNGGFDFGTCLCFHFFLFCRDFLFSNFARPRLKTTKGSHSFWRSIWLKHWYKSMCYTLKSYWMKTWIRVQPIAQIVTFFMYSWLCPLSSAYPKNINFFHQWKWKVA